MGGTWPQFDTRPLNRTGFYSEEASIQGNTVHRCCPSNYVLLFACLISKNFLFLHSYKHIHTHTRNAVLLLISLFDGHTAMCRLVKCQNPRIAAPFAMKIRCIRRIAACLAKIAACLAKASQYFPHKSRGKPYILIKKWHTHFYKLL